MTYFRKIFLSVTDARISHGYYYSDKYGEDRPHRRLQFNKAARRHTTGLGCASAIRDGDDETIAFYRRQERADFATFDEEKEYSGTELEAYADALLRADSKAEGKEIGVYPAILFEEHLYNRRRREILCEQGYPDESITNALSNDHQTIFNRSHPQGRRVATAAERAAGSSFYRG